MGVEEGAGLLEGGLGKLEGVGVTGGDEDSFGVRDLKRGFDEGEYHLPQFVESGEVKG
jgi:hypothetical protein